MVADRHVELFVTIKEGSLEETLRTIRAIELDHDGVEVRAEDLPEVDCAAIRGATSKPVILTYRGRSVARGELIAAIEAGIELVDVEFRVDMDVALVEQHRQRIVLSHHDFEGMERLEEIAETMAGFGCRHVKIAATPRDFAENERLLQLLTPGRSVIGMGERGLYTRILAPFRGSALTFVAPSRAAAPGQLTLANALAIYGGDRRSLSAQRVFAVVGNPAGHSLSPALHNELFRQKGGHGAYTIASVASFAELAHPFLRGEPCGLSVTAPFKEDALEFARNIGARIGANAVAARAVNTLVNAAGAFIADNTDVDGFELLVARAGDVRRAAIAGAGATARAAAVALERAAIPFVIYNRTAERADEPLERLAAFDGDLIIDSLPPGAHAPLPSRHGLRVIRAAYGDDVLPVSGDVSLVDGLELLRAQALRQHQLFMTAFA